MFRFFIRNNTKNNVDPLTDYPTAYPQPSYPADLSPIEKASRIIQHGHEVSICLKAKICPVCGEQLSYIDLNIETSVIHCSKDKSHYCQYDWHHMSF